MVDDADGQPTRFDADALLDVAVDHVVLAFGPRPSRLAPVDLRAGLPLQLQGDVLGDVPDPRPFAQAGQEATGPSQRAGMVLQAREPVEQALGEALQAV